MYKGYSVPLLVTATVLSHGETFLEVISEPEGTRHASDISDTLDATFNAIMQEVEKAEAIFIANSGAEKVMKFLKKRYLFTNITCKVHNRTCVRIHDLYSVNYLLCSN